MDTKSGDRVLLILLELLTVGLQEGTFHELRWVEHMD